jgi:glycosyltransferase involved in cell wall biosynthesis
MNLSVALCTFNGERFLTAQLESLLVQTRRPDELIVCDDASTDATLSLLDRFAASAPFPVRIHRNPATLGSTRNFDQAIGLCTGDIIFLCDQDDVWSGEKLARFTADFADPAVGLAASDLELVDACGRSLGRRLWAELPFTPAMRSSVEAGDAHRVWVRYNTITGAAAAFRASLRDVIRPIPSIWNHDAWIALIAAAVSTVRLIRDPLTRYRMHPAQQIGSAPRTLRRVLHAAHRMDAAYFANVADCFAAAADRLEQHMANGERRHVLLDWLRGKAAFARVQQRMREGSRLGRFLPSLRQLMSGNYHRFSRGWKGFAADLFLPTRSTA